MHCKGCEYPLWNLKDRRCPECGTDFLPSEFKFVARSVKFLCPHCTQQYYGTGADGHLMPRAFACVSCGQGVDMDEMVLLPADGLQTEHTRTSVNPWIERDGGSVFGRFFSTLGKSLVAPTSLIQSTPISSSTGRALLFAAICLLIGPLVGGVMLLIFMLAFGSFAAGGGGGPAPGMVALSVLPVMAIGIGLMVAWMVGWALVTHVLLLITGQTAGGLRRTFQCMSYSAGPTLLTAVPCVGGYLYPISVIWQMVTGSILVCKGQRVSGLRATFAVITPPIVIGAIVVGLFVWFISMGVSAAATAMAQAQNNPTMSVQGVRVQSIGLALDSAAAADGQYPRHAIELITSSMASASEFSLSSNPLASDTIIVGSTTLGRLTSMSESSRTATIAAIVDAQPSDVLAHRIGDYVFSYHGLTPSSDRALWLFIAEAPQQAPTAASGQPGSPPVFGFVSQASNVYFAYQVDGTIRTIPRDDFDAALATQNELRTSLGLGPIPDLSTITSDMPATKQN